MGRLFGTDGVRGIANSKELDSSLAYALGRAGSYVLSKNSDHKSVIFVGKDTRISGDMLESALVAGICSTGAKAVCLGVLPTPAVAYLTRKYGADAGVVISASHNPVEFNGIKFFDREGHKLNDAIEEEIEAIILDNSETVPSPTGKDVGRCETLDSAIDEYVEFAKSTIDCRLDGLTIALDCACGASSICSPRAFSELGAKVYVTGNTPDGTNINDGCGSTHLDNLSAFVKETHSDFGLAFDGDADRMLAVDGNGDYIDGDQIMAACALDLKAQNKLSKNTLVATIMSNMGLFLFGKEYGIEILKTKVGDRYVLERMLTDGYSLGGEQSGHIIFLDHNTTGDGLVSALNLASIVAKSHKSLKEICSVMKVMPQVLYGAKVENSKKNVYTTDAEITEKIAACEKILGESGRVLIRPSGTEPLVRVMIEGEDINLIDKMAKELTELIECKSK